MFKDKVRIVEDRDRTLQGQEGLLRGWGLLYHLRLTLLVTSARGESRKKLATKCWQ